MTDLIRQAPRVICILGMHRSGTSAIARLLNLAGVYLGADEAVSAAGVDNPSGFWEHHEFGAINDQLLERFGGSWSQPPEFPPGWVRSPDLIDLRERAEDLVDTFSGVRLWGFKDPRTSLTLPFWLTLLPSPRFVVCVRNPLSVAASLARRNSMSTDDSMRLWRRYTAEALTHADPERRVIVHAERLFTDWEALLSEIVETLGLRGLSKPRRIRAAVSEFLQDSLWHHRNSVRRVVSSAAVQPATAAFYSLLRKLEHEDPACRLICPSSAADLTDDALLRLALLRAWRDESSEGSDRTLPAFRGAPTPWPDSEEGQWRRDSEFPDSHQQLNWLQDQLQLARETLHAARVRVETLEAEIEQLVATEKSLRHTIRGQKQELSALRAEILAAQERELDAIRQQLTSRREELQGIKLSRWWRLMDRYWRLRRLLGGHS